MRTVEIVITNKLPTGTAFAVTLQTPAESVFVPGKVAAAARAEIGDRFMALLVPNVLEPSKTPWMAARIDASLPFAPGELASNETDIDIVAQVRSTLQGGGVWTAKRMFEHLFDTKRGSSGADAFAAVTAALHDMFAAAQCAKFQLWPAPGADAPAREWFTCYPKRADVDEWEEL